MEFIMTFGALIVIFIIGFLVGAKQSKKDLVNQIKKDGGYYDTEITASVYPIKEPASSISLEEVDTFQKLAGIKPVNTDDKMREILINNNLNSKERIITELVKAAENSEYPLPDIKANATTMGKILDKWTTPIDDLNGDPLVHIPLSRVSSEAKEQMAEIARQDITKQLEEAAKLFPELHSDTDVIDLTKKPKRKYTKRKSKK